MCPPIVTGLRVNLVNRSQDVACEVGLGGALYVAAGLLRWEAAAVAPSQGWPRSGAERACGRHPAFVLVAARREASALSGEAGVCFAMRAALASDTHSDWGGICLNIGLYCWHHRTLKMMQQSKGLWALMRQGKPQVQKGSQTWFTGRRARPQTWSPRGLSAAVAALRGLGRMGPLGMSLRSL